MLRRDVTLGDLFKDRRDDAVRFGKARRPVDLVVVDPQAVASAINEPRGGDDQVHRCRAARIARHGQKAG
ncbi:hypothetical protein [Burkholderia sp. BCC0419]|uniref:hypothetical protein n=1 Tax=Burkholderia sp. BCC0419 TaxID=486878 RepID=UPI00158B8C2B|nr:hypothetical protein [Burkholderia sp. BCC0419]